MNVPFILMFRWERNLKLYHPLSLVVGVGGGGGGNYLLHQGNGDKDYISVLLGMLLTDASRKKSTVKKTNPKWKARKVKIIQLLMKKYPGSIDNKDDDHLTKF